MKTLIYYIVIFIGGYCVGWSLFHLSDPWAIPALLVGIADAVIGTLAVYGSQNG